MIDVDGFDLSPCGGTHTPRTGMVGPVRVVGVERHKGGHRIHFLAGAIALEDGARKERLLGGLARELTCAPEDVPAAVETLRAELRAQAKEAASLRERLARSLAKELLAAAPARDGGRLVVASFPGESVDFLRALGGALCEADDAACVLAAPGPDAVRLLVQRGARSTLDAGALVKRLAAETGGRGGGRPDRAEGQLPAGADVPAALAGL